jgi:hypothetical protein
MTKIGTRDPRNTVLQLYWLSYLAAHTFSPQNNEQFWTMTHWIKSNLPIPIFSFCKHSAKTIVQFIPFMETFCWLYYIKYFYINIESIPAMPNYLFFYIPFLLLSFLNGIRFYFCILLFTVKSFIWNCNLQIIDNCYFFQ